MLMCTDGRRLSPAWFHLCTPRFAIQVSSSHHVKERFQSKPALWTQLGCTGVGLQGEGKEKGFSSLISLHLLSFMAKGVVLTVCGEKETVRGASKGTLGLLLSLCIQNTKAWSVPNPLSKIFLCVAPGWETGCFFHSLPSSPSLHLLEVLLLSCSWLNIPSLLLQHLITFSTWHLCCQKQPTLWYQYLGSSIKRGILPHLFFFSFSDMSWVTSPFFLWPHSIHVNF